MEVDSSLFAEFTKHKLRWSFSGLALLAFGPAGWHFLTLPVSFSESQFELLRPGMTLRDVEEVFGRPSGDYSGGSNRTPMIWNQGGFLKRGVRTMQFAEFISAQRDECCFGAPENRDRRQFTESAGG
jgi:hypothetical protein